MHSCWNIHATIAVLIVAKLLLAVAHFELCAFVLRCVFGFVLAVGCWWCLLRGQDDRPSQLMNGKPPRIHTQHNNNDGTITLNTRYITYTELLSINNVFARALLRPKLDLAGNGLIV